MKEILIVCLTKSDSHFEDSHAIAKNDIALKFKDAVDCIPNKALLFH